MPEKENRYTPVKKFTFPAGDSGVIEATNKVVESVDNLIKELGNEV